MAGIEFMFRKMKQHPIFLVLYKFLTVIILLDFALTVAAIVRWSSRHFNKPGLITFSIFLDQHWQDEFMAGRFVEWRFFTLKKP